MINEEISTLVKKAEEIGVLIKKTETYTDFITCREKLGKDPEASLLVNRLVNLGKTISESTKNGSESSDETLAELEILKSEFDRDETAMEYIDSQKNYLGVLDSVISRILNLEE